MDHLLHLRIPLPNASVDLLWFVRENQVSPGDRFFPIPGHKNGICEGVLTTVRVEERQISCIEVMLAPTDGRGVESDNENRVATFLGTIEE